MTKRMKRKACAIEDIHRCIKCDVLSLLVSVGHSISVNENIYDPDPLC